MKPTKSKAVPLPNTIFSTITRILFPQLLAYHFSNTAFSIRYPVICDFVYLALFVSLFLMPNICYEKNIKFTLDIIIFCGLSCFGLVNNSLLQLRIVILMDLCIQQKPPAKKVNTFQLQMKWQNSGKNHCFNSGKKQFLPHIYLWLYTKHKFDKQINLKNIVIAIPLGYP